LVLLAQGLCAFNDAVARARQIPDKDQKGEDDGLEKGDDGDENLGKDDGKHGGSSGVRPHESTGKKSPSHKRQRVRSRSSRRQATECGLELGDSFGQPFPVCYLSFFEDFASHHYVQVVDSLENVSIIFGG
jgi:hypothetical protein